MRVIYVPVTYDEAFTYIHYVRDSVGHIVTYDGPAANNHILNTLLTKLFVSIADNAFSLRISSLLAQLGFLYFSYKIVARLFGSRYLILTGFLLLNLHPFLFEFWGLCRGYGLALSLLAGAAYFLAEYVSGNTRVLPYCFALLVAACYANFNILNIYPAFLLICLFRIVLYIRKGQAASLIYPVAIMVTGSIALYLLCAIPIKKLIEAKQLYYGGGQGFFADTVLSIVRDGFFLPDQSPLTNVLACGFVLLAVVMIGHAVRQMNKGKYNVHMLTFLALLLLSIISVQLQHYLFNTLFPVSRTALPFVLLYSLSFLGFASSFSGSMPAKIFLTTAAAGMFTCFSLHYNLYQTATWDFDRYDLVIMQKIGRDTRSRKVTIGAFRMFHPVLEYYQFTKFANKVSYVENVLEYGGKDTAFDYYYIYNKDLQNMPAGYRVDTTVGNLYSLVRRCY